MLMLIYLNASWLGFDFTSIKSKKGFDTLCNWEGLSKTVRTIVKQQLLLNTTETINLI